MAIYTRNIQTDSVQVMIQVMVAKRDDEKLGEILSSF